MGGLIPFNRKNSLARTGFEDFYNMLDDFFSDSWLPSRNLFRDTFKIDVQETDSEYRIEAEVPGVKKEEISLDVDGDCLCIALNRTEDVNKDTNNYIHRERRSSSTSRSLRLANVKFDEISAKLDGGVLTIIAPKEGSKKSTHKINID